MFSFALPAISCSSGHNSRPPQRSPQRGPKRPYGYWKVTANLVKELQQFAANSDNQRRMPTHAELLAAGRADIAGAIHRKGTWKAAADDAGLVLTSIARPRSLYLTFCTDITARRMRPYMYWRDFGNLRREVVQFVAATPEPRRRTGFLPSAAQLEAARRTDLVRAIGMHGGFERVARLLDFQSRYHSRAYWAEFANIDAALRQFITEFGEPGVMPPVALLRKLGPPGLLSAIEKWHGGSTAVARRMRLTCMFPKRPHGYWKDRDNRVSEFNAFLLQFRELYPDRDPSLMPSNVDMIRMGRSDLVRALCRYEGFSNMALLVGLRPYGKARDAQGK